MKLVFVFRIAVVAVLSHIWLFVEILALLGPLSPVQLMSELGLPSTIAFPASLIVAPLLLEEVLFKIILAIQHALRRKPRA